MSIWQSFFAMNFKAVKEPDNNPIVPGLNLFWAVAVPLSFGTIVIPIIGAKVFQWIIGNSISLLLKFLFDCTMLALCVWITTPDFADVPIAFLVIIVTSLFYVMVPFSEAISAITQEVKDFHQSEYRSLQATLRLSRKCAITLVEPVVGMCFLFFLVFTHVPAQAYAVYYVEIAVFFLYRFFRIWQSYRRLRKGTNAM
jgi:hypothetical protein